jgi:hypothetical protein
MVVGVVGVVVMFVEGIESGFRGAVLGWYHVPANLTNTFFSSLDGHGSFLTMSSVILSVA